MVDNCCMGWWCLRCGGAGGGAAHATRFGRGGRAGAGHHSTADLQRQLVPAPHTHTSRERFQSTAIYCTVLCIANNILADRNHWILGRILVLARRYTSMPLQTTSADTNVTLPARPKFFAVQPWHKVAMQFVDGVPFTQVRMCSIVEDASRYSTAARHIKEIDKRKTETIFWGVGWGGGKVGDHFRPICMFRGGS